MKIEKKKNENVIEIQEELKVSQGDQDLILEKGDKIEILKEDYTLSWREFLKSEYLNKSNFSEFVFEIPYQKIRLEGVNGDCKIEGNSLKIKVGGRLNEFIVTPEANDPVTIYEDFNDGIKIQMDKIGGVFYGYY